MFNGDCWIDPRETAHQWFYTSDTSGRSREIWGDKPKVWDFSSKLARDIAVMCFGTNDVNEYNNVTTESYIAQYTMFV